jgi:hypothetical protein
MAATFAVEGGTANHLPDQADEEALKRVIARARPRFLKK